MLEDNNSTATHPVGDGEKRPLCPECLTPFNPLQEYCDKCGGAIGQFTPYMPFVNIQFNYRIFGKMWHKVWHENMSFVAKAFCLLLITLYAPIMFVGLPFLLWQRFGKAPKIK